jgi:hypothetical protein
VSAEAHEALDTPKIANINQMLNPYRGRAISESDHGPPDYRIAIFGV